MTTTLKSLFSLSKDQLFLVCPEKFEVLGCNAVAIKSLERPLENIIQTPIDEYFTINLSKKDRIVNEVNTNGIFHLVDKASNRLITITKLLHNDSECLLVSAEAMRSNLSDKSKKTILDENVAGYFRIGTDFKILDCNNSIALQLGYATKNNLINQDIQNLISKSEDFKALFKTLAKQKKIKNHEIRIVNKDGEEQIFLSNVLLEKGESGNNEAVNVTLIDISERVELENKTRRSEERFRRLSNVAIEGIVFLENETILDCNAQFIELLGFSSHEDIIGKSITEFITSYELSKVFNQRNALHSKKNEVVARKKDGSIMLLEASAGKIEQDEKDVDVILFYEITQRKKTELALEQSTERYKSLVDYSPNGIYILVENKIRFVNNTGIELFECDSEDDLYNRKFLDFVVKKYQKEISKNLIETREGSEMSYKEIELCTTNGVLINAGIQATLTVYDNKPAVQITVVDLKAQIQLREIRLRNKITEETNIVLEETNSHLKEEIDRHKKTQQKLSTAQKFTRNIIDSSLDMILAVDNDGNITEFNNAAVQHFGYHRKEILGKNIKLLYHSEKDHEMVSNAVSTNQVFTGEITNKRKNGDTFISLVSSSIIRDADGMIQGSMGVLRDITDRKRIEQEIKKSLTEKEILLQEVHHRVKNNLQVISSILSLQSNYVKDEKTLEILDESQNRIKSMSYIHQTLYQTTDFSSIEFSNYLNTLAKDLIHSYSYSTGPIKLVTDYDEVFLKIDEAIPCGLIVNELVSNALKYAYGEKGGKIFLSLKEKDNMLTLRVGDKGKGLPEDFKYEESDSLGMQLVYSLVDQLDASMELNSGKGTDFLITFERK